METGRPNRRGGALLEHRGGPFLQLAAVEHQIAAQQEQRRQRQAPEERPHEPATDPAVTSDARAHSPQWSLSRNPS